MKAINWRNVRALRKSSLSVITAACCIAPLNMAAFTRWSGGCRFCSDSAAVLRDRGERPGGCQKMVIVCCLDKCGDVAVFLLYYQRDRLKNCVIGFSCGTH